MVFPLDKELHSIRTHVLLKDALSDSRTEASAQIVEALSQGRCYIALDSIANATGFQYWLEMGGRLFPFFRIDLSIFSCFSEGVGVNP